MKNLLLNLVVNTLAVVTGTYVLKGVHVDTVRTAVVVGIVIAVLNTLVKPILVLLTLPITLMTLGIFLLFINAALILLTARLIPGFQVDNMWWAMAFSIVISLVGSVLHSLT